MSSPIKLDPEISALVASASSTDIYRKVNDFDFESRAVVYLLYQNDFVTISIRRRSAGFDSPKWRLAIDYTGDVEWGIMNPLVSTQAFDFENETHLDELFDTKEDAFLEFVKLWPNIKDKIEEAHKVIRHKQLHLGYNWKK